VCSGSDTDAQTFDIVLDGHFEKRQLETFIVWQTQKQDENCSTTLDRLKFFDESKQFGEEN
jgi:hypothetical protein